MGNFTFTKMNSSTLLVAVIAAAIVGASRVAEGQNIPSCASKLVPCASYLNSTTKPPSSCCDPLKEAVKKELTCLCNIYSDPGLLKSFRINLTEAIRLPTLCGIPGDLSTCPGTGTGKGNGTGGSNSSSSSTPASGTGTGKGNGTGGSNSSSSSTPASGQPKNNTGKTASTGIFSFLLIWASVMFI